jgi:phage terminase small subunit
VNHIDNHHTKIAQLCYLQGMPMLTNRKHEIFAREIAAGEGLEASYIRAGYKPGYSARFNASRLRNTRLVKERVNELLDQFNQQAGVKAEYVQAKLMPLLQVNFKDLLDDDGQLKPMHDLPREVTAAVKSIKYDRKTGQVAEVVLTDKVSTATCLLKSIGAINESEPAANLMQFNRIERVIVAAPTATPEVAQATTPAVLDGLHPRLAAILRSKEDTENVR